MTLVGDIFNFINVIAPFDSAMSFDNVGVLVGNNSSAVTSAIVTLDITKEVIEEAVKCGANLIISHHPVIFNPLKALNSNSIPYLLAHNGINAICAHTNLDLAPMGVNKHLAGALKLYDVRLIENECMAVGILENPMSETEFAKHVKAALNAKGLRYTQTGKAIKTVAVSGGAGGDGVELALKYGADALLTGEIKHNYILDANASGICIVDAGHYKTEDVVIAPLAQMLTDKFPNVTFLKTKAFTDNISYI